jgi:hypothetical protein
MTSHGRRALLVAAIASVTAGCVVTVSSGAQPRVELTCHKQEVRAALTNTSTSAQRYTVTIDVGHDGMHEDVLLSSELVPAGGHTDLKDTVLTDDPITCRLKGVQAFAA